MFNANRDGLFVESVKVPMTVVADDRGTTDESEAGVKASANGLELAWAKKAKNANFVCAFMVILLCMG